MTIDLTTAIKELQQDKGISQELIINTIETAISKAYEKYFGTTENLVIRNDNESVLSIFSKKEVVKVMEDDLFEISLENAKIINNDSEPGDMMLVPCNPEDFGRVAIHSAKQVILQRLKEIKKDSIFSDFKTKEGELIIGYIQRIRGDTIYVDLGTYEAVLPKKNQTPHEHYQSRDRIKTIIEAVRKTKRGNVSIILSRSSVDFVKKLIEIEIPEIYDNSVQIFKIVREPGYRTKIAVFSNKNEIDPVGACVGQKGARINNIIKELEGEKIDVLKWNIDYKMFITNALIPAKVDNVIITDEANKKAIAIVDESQLSFAIGKRGLNIKLANILTDWKIDIKTAAQAMEMNIIPDHVQEAEQLFREDIGKNEIDELELPDNIKEVLKNNSINTIEQVIELSLDDIKKLKDMTQEMAETLKKFLDEN
ncbi:MAG: transcription termination/antitermination protein NusA, partial [Spirochaetes bacterium]|nr:transcription termination/antitermination protein NusA [Spirochaetota bacterium]